MNINIENTLQQMLATMQQTCGEQWKVAKPVLEGMLKRKEARLKSLTDDLLKKEITQEDYKSFLEDEKLLMEAELQATQVIAKATAQKAINAAMEVLQQAASTALKSL
jgi:hypothetical protein